MKKCQTLGIGNELILNNHLFELVNDTYGIILYACSKCGLLLSKEQMNKLKKNDKNFKEVQI